MRYAQAHTQKELHTMRTKLAFLTILAFILSSCGTSYQVITEDDKDGDHVIHRMNLNNASADKRSLGMYGQIWIDGEVYKSKGSEPNYYTLLVSCLISPGLVVQMDSSLVIKTDNGLSTYSAMPTRYISKEVEMARSVYLLEKCTFQVDKDMLMQMGSSHSVSFSLRGRDRLLEAKLTSEGIKRFRTFFDDHVK